MKHLRKLALAATALLGLATAASAQEAYTTNDVGLRAGPGTRYPLVRVVPEDAIVYVHGCLRNWDWCDVSWHRSRGWVFSGGLEGVYRNRRIGFDEWHGYADVPYVSFGFGYWDRYYRDRPWYGNWDRWGDRNDPYWRRHHRDGGDWNNTDNNSGNTHHNNGHDWNRTGSNDQGNPPVRGTRRNNNANGDNGYNGDNNSGDNGRMQCAPDDPTCGTVTTHRRNRHDNTQMDDQQQQPQ